MGKYNYRCKSAMPLAVNPISDDVEIELYKALEPKFRTSGCKFGSVKFSEFALKWNFLVYDALHQERDLIYVKRPTPAPGTPKPCETFESKNVTPKDAQNLKDWAKLSWKAIETQRAKGSTKAARTKFDSGAAERENRTETRIGASAPAAYLLRIGSGPTPMEDEMPPAAIPQSKQWSFSMRGVHPDAKHKPVWGKGERSVGDCPECASKSRHTAGCFLISILFQPSC
jgi:hypothetical protein